mgnify:CR=1 FL=1
MTKNKSNKTAGTNHKINSIYCPNCHFPDRIIIEVFAAGVDVPVRIEIAEQTPKSLIVISEFGVNGYPPDYNNTLLYYYYCGLCGKSVERIQSKYKNTIKYFLKMIEKDDGGY